MRAASPQTVDRVLGVLVAVCASAFLVAIGARAGPSITTLLRLSYHGHSSSSSSSRSKKRKSSSRRRRSNSRVPREGALSAGYEESYHSSNDGDDGADEEGDAYYSYAHGSRSNGDCSSFVRAESGQGEQERGGLLVLHYGSCHCGGLAFEVEASEHLVAIEGPSKVRYPFITVPAERFRLTSDDSNGSLYLLKCRAPSERDNTPKVSAHFFCRRCGVHVIHAPDFPHAAVADVNVHCIQPGTIKSLAVAFLRGGEGAELPGVGDPVEGISEVGRESWSDAMRDRVNVALQQQQQQQHPDYQSSAAATAAGSRNNSSSSRALSPRRRTAPSSAASVSGGAAAAGEKMRGFSGKNVSMRGDKDGTTGGTAPISGGGEEGSNGGGVSRTDGVLRASGDKWRNEEGRARRQHAGGLFSAAVDGTRSSTTRNTKTSANIGGGGTTTGGGDDTWGDFLMHVALLSSSSSSGGPTHQHNKAIHRRPNSGMKRGIIATTTKEGHREVGTRSFLPPFGAEEVQQQPKQRMGGASVGGSADSGSLPPAPVSRSVNHHLDSGVLVEAGKADGGPGALEDGRQSAKGEVGSGRTGLRRRRSQSVDSSPPPQTSAVTTALTSPGAEGVRSEGRNEEASGGGPRATSAAGGEMGGLEFHSSSPKGPSASVKPAGGLGVSGGYAAARA